MKTDALRLPFFLNTIVTSPSSPPSSSSSPALHVSTTTHHWGQAPLRQWFIPPSTRLDQLVLQLLRDLRHHQSLSARGNCVHLPRRHLASQPLSPRAYTAILDQQQGHQIYNSFSLLKSKYSLFSILSGPYKKRGFNTNQVLSRSTTAEATAAASIASRLAAVRGGAGWRAHPPHMQLAKHARSQSTARAAQAAAAMTLAENFHTHPPIFIWLINRSRPRPGGRGQIHPIEA
jgi:hypothetical protein